MIEASVKTPESEQERGMITRDFAKEPWFAIATGSLDGAKKVNEYPWRYLHQFGEIWNQPEFGRLVKLHQALLGITAVENKFLQSKIDAYRDVSKDRPRLIAMPTLGQINYLTVRTGNRLARGVIPIGNVEERINYKNVRIPKPVIKITDDTSFEKYLRLFYPDEHKVAVTSSTPRDIKFFIKTFDDPTLPTNNLSKDSLGVALDEMTGMIEVAMSDLQFWPQYIHRLSINMGSLASRCKAVGLQVKGGKAHFDPAESAQVAKKLKENFGSRFTTYPSYSEFCSISEGVKVGSRTAASTTPQDDAEGDTDKVNISQLVEDAFQMASTTEISSAERPKVNELEADTSIYMQQLFEEALGLARVTAEENDPNLLAILGKPSEDLYKWGAQSSDSARIKAEVSAIFWAHLQSIATFRERRFSEGKNEVPTVETVKELYSALGRKTSKESYTKMCVTDTVIKLKKLGMNDGELSMLVTKAGLLFSACLDLQNPYWSKYLAEFARDTNQKSQMLVKKVNSFNTWYKNCRRDERDPRYEGLDEILEEIGVYISDDMSPRTTGDHRRWRRHRAGSGLDVAMIEAINRARENKGVEGTVYKSTQ